MSGIMLALGLVMMVLLLLAGIGMVAAITRLEREQTRQAQVVDAFTQMVLAQQGVVASHAQVVDELLRAYPVDSDAAQRIRDARRRTLAVGVDASKVRVH
jgi:uncharacterized coiled-coil protein SlyX